MYCLERVNFSKNKLEKLKKKKEKGKLKNIKKIIYIFLLLFFLECYL